MLDSKRRRCVYQNKKKQRKKKWLLWDSVASEIIRLICGDSA
jgi:outer membrane protease